MIYLKIVTNLFQKSQTFFGVGYDCKGNEWVGMKHRNSCNYSTLNINDILNRYVHTTYLLSITVKTGTIRDIEKVSTYSMSFLTTIRRPERKECEQSKFSAVYFFMDWVGHTVPAIPYDFRSLKENQYLSADIKTSFFLHKVKSELCQFWSYMHNVHTKSKLLTFWIQI